MAGQLDGKNVIGWSSYQEAVCLAWRLVSVEHQRGLFWGPFNVFISDLKEATEWMLTKFADDTKLGKPVNKFKSGAVIPRDQDR